MKCKNKRQLRVFISHTHKILSLHEFYCTSNLENGPFNHFFFIQKGPFDGLVKLCAVAWSQSLISQTDRPFARHLKKKTPYRSQSESNRCHAAQQQATLIGVTLTMPHGWLSVSCLSALRTSHFDNDHTGSSCPGNVKIIRYKIQRTKRTRKVTLKSYDRLCTESN